MAIDFPTSPTLNELYTSGGRTWMWNGYAWDLQNRIIGFTGSQGVIGYTGSQGNIGYTGSQGPQYGTRVVSIPDSSSITMNADTTDMAVQTNTQAAGNLTINAPTGTPVDGQKLMLRIFSVNTQTFSWNSAFSQGTELLLPATTSGSNRYDYYGFIYNSAAGKWQFISSILGF